jgi:hypothetical protein
MCFVLQNLDVIYLFGDEKYFYMWRILYIKLIKLILILIIIDNYTTLYKTLKKMFRSYLKNPKNYIEIQILNLIKYLC